MTKEGRGAHSLRTSLALHAFVPDGDDCVRCDDIRTAIENGLNVLLKPGLSSPQTTESKTRRERAMSVGLMRAKSPHARR